MEPANYSQFKILLGIVVLVLWLIFKAVGKKLAALDNTKQGLRNDSSYKSPFFVPGKQADRRNDDNGSGGE